MPENVLWVRTRVQIPVDLDLDLPEAMTHQPPQLSPAAIQQSLPVVQLKQACLHGDSLCADLVPMIPLLQPCPPSLVSKRSSRVTLYTLTYFPGSFPQKHLPGRQSSLTTS